MARYSKAIAAAVGGLISIAVASGMLPQEWQTPEATAAIVATITGALVWVSPKNAD